MMKRYGIAILLTACACVLQGHEFWLQPDRFRLKAGEELSIGFTSGEKLSGTTWLIEKRNLERVEMHGSKGLKDLKTIFKENSGENLRISMQEEGTYVFAVQTGNALTRTEGQKFNAFLKEAGLEEAYYLREQENLLQDSASELYSCHMKMLVQVGAKETDTYKKVIGFPAEIMSLENPYSRKTGDRLNFTILYQGKPLFGARVKIMNRYKNRTTIQNIYSQQDGSIETTLSNPGYWMVSFVKMIPSKGQEADWKSYRASLVFGFN